MNKTTQRKMINWYEQYKKSTATSLAQVYGDWSYNKEKSYWDIHRKYSEKYSNHTLRILGHNSSYYTTGAIVTDSVTKDFQFFIVETYASTYICGYSDGDLYDLETGEIFYEN